MILILLTTELTFIRSALKCSEKWLSAEENHMLWLFMWYDPNLQNSSPDIFSFPVPQSSIVVQKYISGRHWVTFLHGYEHTHTVVHSDSILHTHLLFKWHLLKIRVTKCFRKLLSLSKKRKIYICKPFLKIYVFGRNQWSGGWVLHTG